MDHSVSQSIVEFPSSSSSGLSPLQAELGGHCADYSALGLITSQLGGCNLLASDNAFLTSAFFEGPFFPPPPPQYNSSCLSSPVMLLRDWPAVPRRGQLLFWGVPLRWSREQRSRACFSRWQVSEWWQLHSALRGQQPTRVYRFMDPLQ